MPRPTGHRPPPRPADPPGGRRCAYVRLRHATQRHQSLVGAVRAHEKARALRHAVEPHSQHDTRDEHDGKRLHANVAIAKIAKWTGQIMALSVVIRHGLNLVLIVLN